MEPEEIREQVGRIWVTTPEVELLGCIALALAEILEALRTGGNATPVVEPRIPARMAS